MGDILGNVFGFVGERLLNLILPAVATAAAGLLVEVLRRYAKKLGLELTTEQEARIRQLVVDAIKMAEEQGGREGASSDRKRHLARESVLRQVPGIDPDQVDEMIDATLPMIRGHMTPPKPRPSTPATFGR